MPGLELDRMEKDLTSNSALRWTRLAGKPGFTAVRLARGAGAAAAERDQRVHIFEDYNEHGWIMTALPNMKHREFRGLDSSAERTMELKKQLDRDILVVDEGKHISPGTLPHLVLSSMLFDTEILRKAGSIPLERPLEPAPLQDNEDLDNGEEVNNLPVPLDERPCFVS